jgi:peptide-methionine (S)-S-oxide reductase
VIRTRVGYAGGRAESPTYRRIGDHTETVQVDFDPSRISYADLLEVFWSAHTPTERARSGQYMRAVFYHDEEQQRTALRSKAALEEKLGRTVHTPVLSVRTFTPAEDYHQKYLLKHQTDILREMQRIYPRHEDFVDSTAVSRLNGYAGGFGTEEQLARELRGLGLSEDGRNALEERVRRRTDRGLFN